mmetsp:Transcript_11656/g.16520  ORF Transcript_11656/g.16520 Transcript_11656/m.16520 type:complete len:893 (+) Transcript_11656:605-3283(+)|eukprot:CAMPEP_0184871234 /NCGR_PEP_ID=MMETSP0580-20130426/40439_1 /TAXON_ID=1118495 /ORGANISM="Dactyliosolen fragilissimus" /LENGTH=892 /DNA_ID=CAMNT_0027373839 /DNA_START=523 /DNA_END=3201 /DNA_ORIENTATION=-
MGFLKKLFSRKKGYHDDTGNLVYKEKKKKANRKSPKPASFRNGAFDLKSNFDHSENVAPHSPHTNDIVRKPAFNKTASMGSKSSQSGVLSQRNTNLEYNGQGNYYNGNGGNTSPNVVTKPSQPQYISTTASRSKPQPSTSLISPQKALSPSMHNMGKESRNNSSGNKKPQASPPLSYGKLQKFDREQQGQLKSPGKNGETLHHPGMRQTSSQLNRLSNGQLVAMDKFGLSSPMSSNSEFCLSTDVEDNEYNSMRRDANKNFTSMLSPNSHVSSRSDDDDDVNLNPINSSKNLQNGGISSNYISDSDNENDNSRTEPNRSRHYFSDSDNEGPEPELKKNTSISNEESQRYAKERLNKENQNHNRIVKASSSLSSASPATSPVSKRSPKFVFENGLEKSKDGENIKPTLSHPHSLQEKKANSSENNDSKENNSNLDTKELTPRMMAIKKAHKMVIDRNLPKELYPESADSQTQQSEENEKENTCDHNIDDSIEKSNKTNAHRFSKEKVSSKKKEVIIDNFANFDKAEWTDFSNPVSSSTSDMWGHGGPKSLSGSSPVLEIVAQSKERRRENRKQSNSSINSAPVITASFLRAHHKIGERKDQTSKSHAKERFRERSKAAREPNKPVDDDDDDEESQKNESFLLEGVASALGPRGIAADLESLGGKSGKSANSTGGKSRKSTKSHRSHRSRKSSSNRSTSGRSKRHRNKRSDDSVDSRHSRRSHVSTRSNLSQISEQSRSVANDLLRLEMQLAMVGKNGYEGIDGKSKLTDSGLSTSGTASVGSSSIGMSSYASRASRRSKSSGKRQNITNKSKVKIIAPPGKLGLILANKKDSKGTVISGVRTTSVLLNKVHPGDRIIAIDGEDVSRMTMSEITIIMARKNEFERILTLVTTKN